MRLFRFRHSPYARKVEMLLGLMHQPFEVVEVPYTDRRELLALTGGYLHVPVLQDDDGAVVVESRRICERLVARLEGAPLVPAAQAAGIWAYHDWADGPLEDVLFRLASPAVRDSWASPHDRAFYVLIKERKFGAGCVDAWQKGRAELIDRGRALLAPTARTLSEQSFLFGARPTLADAALYGQFAMMAADDGLRPELFGAPFARWLDRLEAARR